MTEADRVNFERLDIISVDLAMVQRFLSAYLDRALYNSQGCPDGVLAEAITVAIIVTYARPFTRSKNRFGKWEDLDLSFLTAPLSDGQRGLHQRTMAERDKAFAHSDAGPQNIKVIDTPDGRLTVSNVVRVLLEKWEAEELMENVRKMKAVLEPRLEELRVAINSDGGC
jgi:hypothetical protein